MECQATEQEKHKISVNLSCLVDTSSSPVGRINTHIEQWVAIGADDYILSMIREG